MGAMKPLALAFLLALWAASVAEAQKSKKEPFNENPEYNYAFAVEDKEEQVFQAHKQKLDDKVVTGEYSYVDPLGTRHTVVYRADEEGFKILEKREEKGFVKVDTPEQIRQKKKNKKLTSAGDVKKVTFRVPKSSADFLTPPSGGNRIRRKKLIRVVKRPKEVSTSPAVDSVAATRQVFEPLPFADPQTTQVVRLRTVPQSIQVPSPTSAHGPVQVQKNVFFVPLKFPRAEEQTLEARRAAEARLREQQDRTNVVIVRQNHKLGQIPTAKVLKTFDGPVAATSNRAVPKTPAESSSTEFVKEVKNRHIDPKSFRTTMLKPKSGVTKFRTQVSVSSVSTSRPKVTFGPNLPEPSAKGAQLAASPTEFQDQQQNTVLVSAEQQLQQQQQLHQLQQQRQLQRQLQLQQQQQLQQEQLHQQQRLQLQQQQQHVLAASQPAPSAPLRFVRVRPQQQQPPESDLVQNNEIDVGRSGLLLPRTDQTVIPAAPQQSTLVRQEQQRHAVPFSIHRPSIRFIPFAPSPAPQQPPTVEGQQTVPNRPPPALRFIPVSLPQQPVGVARPQVQTASAASEAASPQVVRQQPSFHPQQQATLLRFQHPAATTTQQQSAIGLGVQPNNTPLPEPATASVNAIRDQVLQSQSQQQQQTTFSTGATSSPALSADQPRFIQLQPISFAPGQSPFLRVVHSGQPAAEAAPTVSVVPQQPHHFTRLQHPLSAPLSPVDSSSGLVSLPQGVTRVSFRSPGINYEY